ncbi:hypothetical protein [Moraxella lacunata]
MSFWRDFLTYFSKHRWLLFLVLILENNNVKRAKPTRPLPKRSA